MDYKKARAFCAKLRGVTVDVKWGCDLVYSVGEKMFAVTNQEAGHEHGFSLKVDDERFLELTDREGIIPSPYLARAKWIRVTDIRKLSDEEASALLKRSYELVFAKLTKKKQREIGDE